jgi:hypothetical protein
MTAETGGTGAPAPGMGGDDFEVRAADEPIAAAEDVLEFGPAHHAPQLPGRWSSRVRDRIPGWIARPPRVPTAALLVGIIVGVGIAIAVMGGQRTKVIGAPSSSSSPSASPTARFAVDNPGFQSMVDLAGNTATLHDVAIADDSQLRCPAGTAAYPDPVNAVVAVVHTYLPAFTFLDASRGVDLAGVCSVRVRERDPAGPILVISVDSPPNSGGVPFVLIENNDDDSVIDVLAITDGWRIEVLTAGVTGLQPRSTDLQQIAADPRVVW